MALEWSVGRAVSGVDIENSALLEAAHSEQSSLHSSIIPYEVHIRLLRAIAREGATP